MEKSNSVGIGIETCLTNPEVDTAGRQSQTKDQLQLLNNTILSLRDSVNILTDRLEPVLRAPEPTNECCDKNPPEEQLAPLAGEIRSCHNRACDINDLLNDLLNRLEV